MNGRQSKKRRPVRPEVPIPIELLTVDTLIPLNGGRFRVTKVSGANVELRFESFTEKGLRRHRDQILAANEFAKRMREEAAERPAIEVAQ